MSDSTLSGRSAALRKLNRLTKTKLPKGNGELPENFKYVWLVLFRVPMKPLLSEHYGSGH